MKRSLRGRAAPARRPVLAAGLTCLTLFGCGEPGAPSPDQGGSTSLGGVGGSVSTGGATASGGSEHASGGLGGTSTGAASGAGGQSQGQPTSGGVTSQGGLNNQGGTVNAGSGGTAPSTGGSPDVHSGGTNGSASGGTGGAPPPATGGATATGGSAGTSASGGKASGGGGAAASGGQAGASATGGRSIWFGTLLDAATVMSTAQQLAKSAMNPGSAQWRAKGDQHRSYRFAEAGKDEPYRLYVPSRWDGQSPLPLVVFLHGSGSNENTYVDQNGKQLLNLAEQHGYVLVSPLGDQGAYGNFLRLSAPFGNEPAARMLMSQVTSDSERTNELSEKDVINVLELVLSEYPIDRGAMFLAGHSMGSGGTWYIGGKYAGYWRGIAPLSGPFVQESGYPWSSVQKLALFVTEGTQAPSLDASRLLRDWLGKNGITAKYKEVNADHGGMIPLVLPDIFDFFDAAR